MHSTAMGVPLHEAIRYAGDPSRLKPYKEARLRGAVDCWTGTLVAYTSPGKKLGDAAVKIGDDHFLSHEGLYIPVPESALDKKDVVLVRNIPLIVTSETDGLLIGTYENIELLPFPSKYGGNFKLDETYGLPIGKETRPGDEQAGYLWRADQYVGLVACVGATIANMKASREDRFVI